MSDFDLDGEIGRRVDRGIKIAARPRFSGMISQIKGPVALETGLSFATAKSRLAGRLAIEIQGAGERDDEKAKAFGQPFMAL